MYTGLSHAPTQRSSTSISRPKIGDDAILASWAQQDYRDRKFFEDLEERETKLDTRAPRTFDDSDDSDDEANWDEDPELEKLSTAIYRETLANLKTANYYERRTMLQHIENMRKDRLLSKSQASRFKSELEDAVAALENRPQKGNKKKKANHWVLPESGVSGTLREQIRQRDPQRVELELEELRLRAEHSKRLLSLSDKRKGLMIRLAALMKSYRVLASLAATKPKPKREASNITSTITSGRSSTCALATLTPKPRQASYQATTIPGASTTRTTTVKRVPTGFVGSSNPGSGSLRSSALSRAGSSVILGGLTSSSSNLKSSLLSRQGPSGTSLLPALPTATTTSAMRLSASPTAPQPITAKLKESHSQTSLASAQDIKNDSSIADSDSSEHAHDADESNRAGERSGPGPGIDIQDTPDYDLLRHEAREGWVGHDLGADSTLVDFGSLSVTSIAAPHQILELRRTRDSDDDEDTDDANDDEDDDDYDELSENKSEDDEPSHPTTATNTASSKSSAMSNTSSKLSTSTTGEKMNTAKHRRSLNAGATPLRPSGRAESKVQAKSGGVQGAMKSVVKTLRKELAAETVEEVENEDDDVIEPKSLKTKKKSMKQKRSAQTQKSDLVILMGDTDPHEGAWKLPKGELGEDARAERRKQERLKETQVQQAIVALQLRIDNVEKKRDDLVAALPELATTRARHDAELEAELAAYQAKLVERNQVFGKETEPESHSVGQAKPEGSGVVKALGSSSVGPGKSGVWAAPSSLPPLPTPVLETGMGSNPESINGISWGKTVQK